MKKLDKNNPFKTPEGYFEDFKASLNHSISKEGYSIPKKEGFTVPDNYFDAVQDSILEKIAAEEPRVIPLNAYRKYFYATAAIAAIVMIIFGLNLNTTAVPTFESLAESDIETYFETNEYELSAYEIAEVIPLDELEINDMLSNRFEEEHVLDYLDENIDHFEELNLEDYE